MDPKPDDLILPFASSAAFDRWLARHHAQVSVLWIRHAKKGSGEPSLTWTEAVDVALCYGWIDGQKKSFDDRHWLQKFTRRGPRSVWSKVNISHIERLTAAGRMQPAGLAAVDAAKTDGRWEQAYHSSASAEVPADFVAAVYQDAEARAFYESLNKANRYSIYFRLTTAKKPETRARRFELLLGMMKRGERIH